MPPIFKNKRKRLRALMSSVLPAAILHSLGTATGTKSLPPLNEKMSVRSWIRLVHMGIRPWDSESVEIWEELNGYRLEKAHHVKEKGTFNEHEYVICEFSSEENIKLELRFDRSAGERKDNDSMNSVPSSTASTNTTKSSVAQSHIGSSAASPHSSPRGSLLGKSFSSLKSRMSKSSASLERNARRLSHSSIPHISDISLQEHLAADSVKRIKGHPANALLLKTLTFSGDPAQRPNLCDLMVLVDVLYNESDVYSILDRQCYWHADTIFAALETWALEHNNGNVSTIEDKKRRQASTGSFGRIPLLRRDVNQVQRIWDCFMRGRRMMEEKRAEYERTSKEEIRRKFSKEQEERERLLTSQMRKAQEEKEQRLKKDQDERERRLRREQEDRERRLRKELRKEQEEKERRMKKEQEETERRMKKEQEEIERRMKKEHEELKQYILDQQQQMKFLMRLIDAASINAASPPTASITLPDGPP